MTRPAIPRLHLIGPLDGVLAPESYPAIAAVAVAGGVDAVQVRLPRATGGQVMDLVRDVAAALRLDSEVTLFVNDRVDVALLAEAGGVQLGEHSLTVKQTRQLVSDQMLIGRSVHDVDGAKRAEQDGADFVIAGHIFDTGSKPDEPGRGIEWLGGVVESITVPVIAIGGITAARVSAVIDARAWGIAVGREILTAPDPGSAACALRRRLEGK